MSAAILFDLDGTLIDSEADIATAANRARAALGLGPLERPDIARHIGRGLRYLLQHVVPNEHHGRLDEARDTFVTWYRAHLLDETRPYPGVGETLESLSGHPLAIVTNKPAMFLDPILAGLGWTRHFHVVVGGDTLPERKPHPAPLLHALRELDAASGGAVYVGDSEVDQEAAANAGLRFLCVGWGRAAGRVPDPLARFADLPARVAGLAR